MKHIIGSIRLLWIVLTMALFLSGYWVTRLFFKHTPEAAFRLRRNWIRIACLPIMNIHIDLKGEIDTSRPALVISNHRSFLDPVIQAKFVDAYIIAKAEIAEYPLINKGAEATGIIWVKRESKESRSATRKAYIETIKRGYNVMVYPEGTVSTTKKTFPFKAGTFFEAVEHNIPIIPMALEYRDASDMWTIPSLVKQYFKQCGKWRIETKLSIGEPMTATDGEELRKMAEDWVNQELSEMQKDWSRAFPSASNQSA